MKCWLNKLICKNSSWCPFFSLLQLKEPNSRVHQVRPASNYVPPYLLWFKSNLLVLLWQTLSSSHGSALPSGHGPQQESQGGQGREKAEAQLPHGHLSKHTTFVRVGIQEVCGFGPYEQCTMELLKVFKDKQALKFIEGEDIRVKRKREEHGWLSTSPSPPPRLP